MIRFLKISSEAVRQAIFQLSANKLRTLLSLLGISVGIFCIISVFASVDSLERNVKDSLQRLGDDVLYISKMPWIQINRSDFWKYIRRPNPSYRDFLYLQKRSKSSASIVAYSVFLGEKTFKTRHTDFKGYLIAVSDRYEDIFSFEYDDGRFFSYAEYHSGAPVAVLGYETAQNLFGSLDPIGRTIRYRGATLKVVGVLAKKGKELVSVANFDETVIISIPLARRIANLNTRFFYGGTNLMVKARPGVSLDELEDQVRYQLRAARHLRPRDEDNFSLNKLTMITKMLSGVFAAMNVAGFIIGGFAMLVGMVSIANIMFVSVRERTPIIGIKKALGAKRWFILTEVLVESVILSVLGGVFGLALVRVAVIFISKAFDYQIALSLDNVISGLLISAVVGILAGLIPAFVAARLDPVEAIRR